MTSDTLSFLIQRSKGVLLSANPNLRTTSSNGVRKMRIVLQLHVGTRKAVAIHRNNFLLKVREEEGA